ncbi:MAG: hypothetical protein C0418_02345 [Coriobacteriaceae bacterium]|nr:hypothetical protein [Coriobacteriaceae bacterium]
MSDETPIGTNEDISRVDLMLLGMLARRPLHGYELVETLSAPGMSLWAKFGRTTVYKALARLEKDGRVSCHEERAGAKPDRRVFSVTPGGRDLLYRAVGTALQEVDQGTPDAFDVALYYSAELDPQTARTKVEERAASIDSSISATRAAAIVATAAGDLPGTFVLEHRLAILHAEADFLRALAKHFTVAAKDEQGILRGTLERALLHEVLRNLESAGRTGELEVDVRGWKTCFLFRDGRLTGLVPPIDIDRNSALASAFQIRGGAFVFRTVESAAGRSLPVNGVTEAILIGCRGVLDPKLLDLMAPDEVIALDVNLEAAGGWEGYSLTEDELAAIGCLDGVRDIGDMAVLLRRPIRGALSIVYPLWAAGWVTRAGAAKRRLALATVAFLRGWEDAIVLIGGPSVVGRIRARVTTEAGRAGLPDYWTAVSERRAVSFAGHVSDVSGSVRGYCEIVRAQIEREFGLDFVASVEKGLADRITDPLVDVLNEHRILRADGVSVPGESA